MPNLNLLCQLFPQATRDSAALPYLRSVLELCPNGARSCELLPPLGLATPGGLSGYAAVWLSLRGVDAAAVLSEPLASEAWGQAAAHLDSAARFSVGSLWEFTDPGATTEAEHRFEYDVIHHSDLLSLFPVPWMQALLAQQVASAHHVVFRVPSMYYTGEELPGQARLLPLEEWHRILAPFDVEELAYCGDGNDQTEAGRSHILGVLRGRRPDSYLRSLMRVGAEPFRPGISAIVHTRNEAVRVAECLQSLRGWTDEIIVCDMESDDGTLDIVQDYTTEIIRHNRIANFDRARNVSASRARYSWVLYVDADERVPPPLAQAIRDLVDRYNADPGSAVDAAFFVPFRHHFAGYWLRCLYPGYTAPRLFKNGRFFFNARLHSGAHVEGHTGYLPADNPDCALVHLSSDNVAHHIEKMGRYTDGEAGNMFRDGKSFSWQEMIGDFVRDTRFYYDGIGAHRDGAHGMIYSLLGGMYRFVQHAKLHELRYRDGKIQPAEDSVPPRLDEVLEYALHIARQQPEPAPAAITVATRVSDNSTAWLTDRSSSQLPTPIDQVKLSAAPQAQEALAPDAAFVWSGPLLSPSGYGEQSRQHVFGLHQAGVNAAAHIIPWGREQVELAEPEQTVLREMTGRPAAPGFVHLVHNFPGSFFRHPQAGVSIGRTVFETDRLPAPWVQCCNRMDYVWVPSEFNRASFEAAGVAAEKLRVFPESLDPNEYVQPLVSPLVQPFREAGKFVFLSVFDWTLHKGWDVLLRGFLQAFEGRDDAVLLLKVWSTMHYSAEQVRAQAAQWVQQNLGHDLLNDDRIRFLQEQLPRDQVRALYWSADAYVLPTRGEGWGRPFMEAMACGRPVIGTNWSGNTAFMNAANSYLLDYQLRAVPEAGWREVVTYKGHRWAEPDATHLSELMRRVVDERGEAQARGQLAREEVLATLDRTVVARQMGAEIEKLIEEQRPHSVGSPSPTATDNEEQTPAVVAAPRLLLPPRVSERAKPARVRWEGEFFVHHSFGHINRELPLAVLDEDACELSLLPLEEPWFDPGQDPRFARLQQRMFAPLSGPAHAHVRHVYPPRLDVAPPEGHFVLIQPWEYGSLPEQWVDPIRRNVDEVWCISNYVREIFRSSGIPEDRLHLFPWGVNERVLHPAALPYAFSDEPGGQVLADNRPKEQRERFVFLFVGGTLERKGIDILLEAYIRAFSAHDDVCLLIKDTGTKSVYYKQNAQERILTLAADPSRPPIVYVEDELSEQQLAGIFVTGDCYVHPYRGEGFCLPVLEAMSCGLPVIVPEGGPTDDFVDEEVGWRVPAAHVKYGDGTAERGRIGHWECAGPTWVFEVAVNDLVRQMRAVVADRDATRVKGETAAKKVREGWTWHHSARRALERVEALRAQEPLSERRRSEISKSSKSTAVKPGRKGKRVIESAVESSLIWVPPAVHQPAALPIPADKGAKNGVNGTAGHRNPATISLCMIVRNEERVLGDCLQSIKPWVDEIIVVDTGSTDGTVAIAEAHGAKVVDFPWVDCFSTARNVSLQHATGDWVLWMDADDTIPAECGSKLRDLAALAEERTTGFLMQVHIPAAPGENGFTVVDHVKLFRNRKELRFEGRIHEQILESIYRAGGKVDRTDLYVVHSGYDYSTEGQKNKRERDFLLLEKDLQDRPDHPFVLFNIGMTCYYLKDYPRAVQALDRCLEKSKPNESTVRKVYAMRAGCEQEQGRSHEARQWLDRGLQSFPNDPELLFRAGIVHRDLGDLPAAERSLVKLLTEREIGHIDSLDVSMMGYKAHHNLALIYQDMGRFAEAERAFQAAVTDNPSFVQSWLGLGELYLRVGQPQRAREVAERLGEIAPEAAEEFSRHLASVVG